MKMDRISDKCSDMFIIRSLRRRERGVLEEGFIKGCVIKRDKLNNEATFITAS